MINKEIEELLKGMRDVSNTEGACMNLDRYLVKLLLSYIEQLEKRNKELYEGFMATQEELTDYATKNEQLKKQKYDVVEYIKNNKLFKYVYDEEELFEIITDKQAKNDLLRMLGEIE